MIEHWCDRLAAIIDQMEGQTPEDAFKAGYHCHWSEGQYVFDPDMRPGDPDGAYRAWQIFRGWNGDSDAKLTMAHGSPPLGFRIKAGS